MKIYIAGPMRSYPAFNFPAFHAAAKDLRERGHAVWSPAENDEKMGFDPSKATGLFHYRRIIDRTNFAPGTYAGDVTLVNWPQNDYMLGNLFDVPAEEAARHVEGGKQLSLSWLYWLQTECPRPDGGTGWKGLRLRPDITGTEDGLAKYP